MQRGWNGDRPEGAIVRESFAEIFLGNCVAMDISCVTATPEAVKQLQAAIATTPDLPVTINLEPLTVAYDLGCVWTTGVSGRASEGYSL